MYYALMPHIQIRNVSDEAHTRLKVRAAKCGKSLQEYMRAEIESLAAKPTWEELFARIDSSSGGSVLTTEDIVSSIHEARAEREEHLMRLHEVAHNDPDNARRSD